MVRTLMVRTPYLSRTLLGPYGPIYETSVIKILHFVFSFDYFHFSILVTGGHKNIK